MKRLLLASCAILCLSTFAASAADPKVDSAISVFQSVGSDPAKLKAYCELSDAVEAQGDKDDDASETALDPYMDRLGDDFEEAWNTNEETDENSADGKRLSAATDALDAACPDD